MVLCRLFQTLDPMLRQAVLPSGRQVILSDTVGFIDNLPPSLIKAFQVSAQCMLSVIYTVCLASACCECATLVPWAAVEVACTAWKRLPYIL